MEPKQKAEELIEKYNDYLQQEMQCIVYVYQAKQCALIAVDEILEYIDSNHNGYYTMPESVKIKYDYYEEVKQELEKL